MNTISSRDQFKPIRIGENLLVSYEVIARENSLLSDHGLLAIVDSFFVLTNHHYVYILRTCVFCLKLLRSVLQSSSLII